MEKIERLLEEQIKLARYRTLIPIQNQRNGFLYIDNKKYVDFSSNDYLGLSQHPAIKKAAITAIKKFKNSTCSSRLLSGNLKLFCALEEKIANFKKKEAGLVFNSGYQANVGIISSLCSRDDVIFSDKLNHASIIDGIILSGAKFFRFRHNDLTHLEDLLKKERHKFKNSLIIVETIFSMDGDKAPLKQLVRLKEKYNSILMVDEAHATGIFGKNGTGVVEEEDLSSKIEIIMGTFSKALGCFGAYVACSKKIREYFINFCRSFIYSTALPPAIINSCLVSIELIKKEPHRRKILLENAFYLRKKLKDIGFNVIGCSQIVPVIVGEEKETINLSIKLKEKGFWVPAIRPPTVLKGSCRLRFSLNYYHKKDILDKLVDALAH
ncbi:MAG: 8-amino-7-oxononanoate synthase [Candidatus Omnitrophica bacterium]|nr:8-amino-7-oxononanoate synthase [Candidatus Omnitrophota bacterium]